MHGNKDPTKVIEADKQELGTADRRKIKGREPA